MHQKHQAVSPSSRATATLGGTACLLEALSRQISLQLPECGYPREAISSGCGHDSTQPPSIWLNEGIELVPGVSDPFWGQGHPDGGAISKSFCEYQSITSTNTGPLRKAVKLDAADNALQFGEAKV